MYHQIKIAQAVDVILNKYRLKESFTISDLLLGIKFVRSNKLSRIITDYDFPPLGTTRVWHFTSYKNFQNIIQTGKILLNSISKRLLDEEAFSLIRGCRLTTTDLDLISGKPYRDLITNNMFFFSFASIEKCDEKKLWSTFGDKGNGVRLTFTVIPHPTFNNFRQVRYEAYDTSLLLLDLCNCEEFEEVRFLHDELSRLCAFYLPFRFYHESEIRLLVEDHVDNSPFKFSIGIDGSSNSHVTLDINNNNSSHVTVRLDAIAVKDDLKHSVQTLVANTRFSDLVLEPYPSLLCKSPDN